MNHYKIFGEKPVSVVVEMGLGACLSEWIPFAEKLSGKCGVLLYERAGINHSAVSEKERTPENIARELADLLHNIEHKDKLTIIAHSQGGLYAQQFCRLYPECVEKVIFLDPLSPRDYLFKEQLSETDYKKSGVDKSANFVMMRKLAKMKMGWLTKTLLKNAPPFYYFNGYSKEQKKDILGAVDSVIYANTVLEEYTKAHAKESVSNLLTGEGFPDIPLILVTHSSELGIKESMLFGRNTEEFATKIENMWQDIMKEYLTYSSSSRLVRAEKSTHYIHLQEPELIIDLV